MRYEKPYIEVTIFDSTEVCDTTLVSGDSSVDSDNMGWGNLGNMGSFGDPF